MSQRTHQAYTRFQQHKFIASFIGCLVVGLIVANVVLAAELSHLGINLQTLDNRAKQLTQENLELTQAINQSGSLRDLEQKAETLGFKDDVTYQYFTNAQTVAYTQDNQE